MKRKSKIGHYQIHPAAEIFPLMDDAALARLAEDIATNGQRVPIILLRGRVLDGRNRLLACLQAGIDPIVQKLENCSDPIAIVLSENLHRRHLTTSQRALCAARIARHKPGTNQHRAKGRGLVSISEAAEVFRIAPRTVDIAKHVIDRGDPTVVTAVENGLIPIALASQLVNRIRSKRRQRTLVEAGILEIRKAAKEPAPAMSLDQALQRLDAGVSELKRKWPTKYRATLAAKLIEYGEAIRSEGRSIG